MTKKNTDTKAPEKKPQENFDLEAEKALLAKERESLTNDRATIQEELDVLNASRAAAQQEKAELEAMRSRLSEDLEKLQNMENAKQKSKSIAQSLGAVSPKKGIVTIGYCSPQAITFRVNGKTIMLNGAKLSDIVDSKGERIRHGNFGLTKLPVEDWDALLKAYGHTKLFKSDRIFVEGSKSGARKEADEREDIKHGLEQVDPTAVKVEEEKQKS